MGLPANTRPNRPASRVPVRPLARLENPSADPAWPTGLGWTEHPAAVDSSWSSGLTPAPGGAGSQPSGDLGCLADRASIQLASLRAALQDAFRIEHAVGHKGNELSRRLEQALRFERDMDQRLAEAARSGQVLSQAAAALSGLERVIHELRATQVSAEAGFRRELEAQQARIDRRLAEHEARLVALIDHHAEAAAARLSDHAEAVSTRATEISAQAHQALDHAHASAAGAESHAQRIAGNIGRNIKAETDRLAAALERQSAQVQARTAVIMDDAGQRLGTLEQSAKDACEAAAARLETVCGSAAAVLGHDPRRALSTGAEGHAAQPGSLEDWTARAEAAARATDEAVVRLSIAADRAGLVSEAEGRLASLRDECESMAASVRFNLTQVQQAEAILGKSVERAGDRARTLDNAMDQVTEQAASMVEVARDVAGLVMRAEQARGELAAITERIDEGDAEPASAGRIRRAPFGPPHAHSEEQSAAAA